MRASSEVSGQITEWVGAFRRDYFGLEDDREAAFVVDVPNIGGPTVERACRVDVVIDP